MVKFFVKQVKQRKSAQIFARIHESIRKNLSSRKTSWKHE